MSSSIIPKNTSLFGGFQIQAETRNASDKISLKNTYLVVSFSRFLEVHSGHFFVNNGLQFPYSTFPITVVTAIC